MQSEVVCEIYSSMIMTRVVRASHPYVNKSVRERSLRNLLGSSLPVFAQNHSPETHSLFQYKLPWESSGTILVLHTEHQEGPTDVIPPIREMKIHVHTLPQ